LDWVVQIGLVELAIGGLLGWAMLTQLEKPEWVKRAGIVAPQRIRQVQHRLWYRTLGLVSFIGVSGGLVAAAIVGPA
jgi:uncharacterized membrane protein